LHASSTSSISNKTTALTVPSRASNAHTAIVPLHNDDHRRYLAATIIIIIIITTIRLRRRQGQHQQSAAVVNAPAAKSFLQNVTIIYLFIGFGSSPSAPALHRKGPKSRLEMSQFVNSTVREG
jgi:hypothetical protein